MIRNSSSGISRKKQTECEGITSSSAIGPLIFLSNRFRWAFCQLVTLWCCRPGSLRRTLNQSPQALGVTYERILKEIPPAKQGLAYRLLQCLTVALRPLRVE